MDKEKKINYLIETGMNALQKWDELSNAEQTDVMNMILEAGRLSSERSIEAMAEAEKVKIETERLRVIVEERLVELETDLMFYQTFIAENGLTAQYEQFIDGILNDFTGKIKPNLTLVQ